MTIAATMGFIPGTSVQRFTISSPDLRIDAANRSKEGQSVHRFLISGPDLAIAAAKRSKQGQSVHRFSISAPDLRINAAIRSKQGNPCSPRAENYAAAGECRMGRDFGRRSRPWLRERYSKRKTRVFSIIFRCRFFERTSHIVDIRCAQRGVPPLAARPSPEKFFIVSMIIAMRKRITPSGTMLCACILKAATCWRCRLTNTSNGHEV